MGETCKDASFAIAQLQSLQSRYTLSANHTFSTTNNYIVLDASRGEVIAGGAHFQATFSSNASKQGETSGFDTAVDGDSTLCGSHINSWILGDGFRYIFASTGSQCIDAFRLFRSPVSSPTRLNEVIAATTVMSVTGSALFIEQGQLVLCYVPAGSLALHCQLPTSSSPSTVYVANLVNMRAVARVGFSPFLRAVIVAGFGSDGCLVEFFQLNLNTLVVSNIRNFAVSILHPECIQVDCMIEANRLLLLGISEPQRVAIIALPLQTFAATSARIVVPSGQCTAIALDHESDLGFAAFQRLTSTTAVKFAAVSAQVDGGGGDDGSRLRILSVRSLPNVVLTGAVIDPRERIAFAVVRQSIGVVMLRFFLPDVLSVAPQYVDRRGGTRVTVRGRGFNGLQPSTMACMFGSERSAAQFIDNQTIVCVAPSVSTLSCELQPVEVSLNGWGFTANSVGITRAEPPVLIAASPQRIRSTDFLNVTVLGQGFAPTGTLVCRFHDGVDELRVTALFLSATSILCLPFEEIDVFLYANGTLDVSLDGDTFTNRPVPFQIVGPTHSIVCEPAVITNTSAARTTFEQQVAIVAKDAKNNSVLALDIPFRRIVNAWFQRSATTSNVSISLRMEGGFAMFINPEFVLPAVGDVVVRLVVDDVFPSSFIIRVLQGELHRLNITQQPATEVFSGERLSRNPRLELLDISGNRWIPDSVTLVIPSVEVDGRVRLNYPAESVSASGEVEFFNLPIDSRFGIQLFLVFTVPAYPNVPPVRSVLISANCAASQYRRRDPDTGELSCRPCPEGASCSGTEDLVLLDGYWRANASIPVVYECDRRQNCRGGSAVGVCADGTTGPMCTLCITGYGKDQAGTCTKCNSRAVVIVSVIGTVVLSFIAVVAVTLMCIQFYDDEDPPLVVPIMLIDFGQSMTTLRFLDFHWPNFIGEMFSWSGMITDFELHSLASDCELRANGKSYLDRATFYYSSLLFAPLFALIVKLVLQAFPNIMLRRSLISALNAGKSVMSQGRRAVDKGRRVVDTVRETSRRRLKRSTARGTAAGDAASVDGDDEPRLASPSPDERRGKDKSTTKKSMRLRLHHVPENHKLIPVLCVSLQVYLFLSYQATSNHALNIFECRTIVRGPTPESLLTQDLSVDCDSAEYKSAYGAAVFMSLLYGLAIPVATTVLTAALVSRFRGEKAELRHVYLSFQLLGLREGSWYWRTIVLIRKFLCLVVAIWNPYPMNAFLTMWIVNVYTIMVWKVRPYVRDINNFIDIMSFYCIAATINGGLLYRVSPWQALRICIIIAVFLLYATLAAAVIYYTMGKLRRAVHECMRTVLQMRIERDEDDDKESAASDFDIESDAEIEVEADAGGSHGSAPPPGLLQEPLLERATSTPRSREDDDTIVVPRVAPTLGLPPFGR